MEYDKNLYSSLQAIKEKYEDLLKKLEDPNLSIKEATNINKTIDTKIANLSIGNPILNNLEDYFLATSPKKDGNLIYTVKKDFTLEESEVEEEKYIVPCITIKKENLKKGTGTIDDPYRTE